MSDKRLPAVKTTVLVKDLVSAIERVRDAELKVCRTQNDKYQAARAKHAKEVRDFLRARVAQITADFEPPRKWGRRSIADWVTDGMPEPPECPTSEACVRSKYDNLIAQLKLSADPKVKLSAEDFRKFMTGDASACAC